MKKNSYFFPALVLCPVLCLALFAGCSGRGAKNVSSEQKDEVVIREFPSFQIPSVYTSAPDRAAYTVEHFWDEFLSTSSTYPCDSLLINGVTANIVEEQFSEYIAALMNLSEPPVSAEAAAASVGIAAASSPAASSLMAAPSLAPKTSSKKSYGSSSSKTSSGSSSKASSGSTASKSASRAGASSASKTGGSKAWSPAAAANDALSIARKGIEHMFRQVEAKQLSDPQSNVYDRFEKLAQRYLYDPNSPYRCEDLYLSYLYGLVASPLTDSLMVPAYTHDIKMCSLNKVGDKVPNFVFKDINGKTKNLYGVKADYVLLFFSNPGCEACKEIIESIKGDFGLQYLFANKSLAIVNVYIDEDIEAWKAYQDYYPGYWYNGYDPTYTIRKDIKYNVRAIPSLYLLDSQKRVIMKDAPENRIFAYLNNLHR